MDKAERAMVARARHALARLVGLELGDHLTDELFEARSAIAMEARQGGDGETRLHPKDDSAGLKGIAQ